MKYLITPLSHSNQYCPLSYLLMCQERPSEEVGYDGQVQHLPAYGHPYPLLRLAGGGKHSIGQVLQWEMRICLHSYPGYGHSVVGCVVSC